MPFGIGSLGGSSTRSSSQSSSRSNAGSQSGGVSFSNDRIAFEDIFARMFGGAEGAAGGLDPSMLTEAANQLFSGGMGFMDQLSNDAGSQYLEDRLSSDNEVLQQQIDLLGEDLGNFFSEQLNPAITSQSVSGGALGGGRQGVAQGVAAEQVGEQFTRGATALRASDIAARDAAANNLSQNNIQNAMVGFQGANILQGISEQGFSAALRPYQLLSSILGGPTTLNDSSSFNFANSFSNSFSQSSANSRSRSFDIGFS